MPGKVHPDDLRSYVFNRTGSEDEAVLQGPAPGEDAAAIELPAGPLVVSSDPISLAASHVGTLGIHIACNDVAVSGVDPRWLTVVLLLPEKAALDPITADLDAAAQEVSAAIVGGHSEYVDGLERTTLSVTAMGTGEFIPTGGAEPGNRIVLTKGAAIEGTAILASDFGAELGIGESLRSRAEAFLEEISVVPDARILRAYATAMHDPTEGGILAGLQELASASAVRLDVERDAIPVRKPTRRLCAAADVDPLRILGSGSAVATVTTEMAEIAVETLESSGIESAIIGTVERGEPRLELDGEIVEESVRDELYPLWETA